MTKKEGFFSGLQLAGLNDNKTEFNALLLSRQWRDGNL